MKEYENVKNLANILDSNTLYTDSLQLYSKFLENCQNLDLLERKIKNNMYKSKNHIIPLAKNNNNTKEIPKKIKSNDILGYLKMQGANGSKEKMNEEPHFVKYIL